MTSLRRVAVWTLVASAAWGACESQAFGWRYTKPGTVGQDNHATAQEPVDLPKDRIVLASAEGRAVSGMSVSLSMPTRYPGSNDLPTSAGRTDNAPTAVSMTPVNAAERFDLVVNNAPASQVFLQLGSGTSYNMLVSPEVTGNISISLRRTTVPEALEALHELFGYDFRIASGNRVFVYPNVVQTRLFRINYLPGRRIGSSELSVSSTTTASSNNSSGGSSSSSSSSSDSSSSGARSSVGRSGGNTTSTVQTVTDTDFWRDVRQSLTSLVGEEGGRGVTINAAAGVIVVRAAPSELRQVTEYLRAVQVTIERQVMLEAKIIEVRLNKSSETGINWGLFRTSSNGGHTGLIGMAPGVSLTGSSSNGNVTVTPGTGIVTSALGKGFYGLSVNAPNFSALLSFLETQGDVQVLSSPRVAALNNQKAVLKVGRDETFVTEIASNTTTSSSTTTSSPTVKTSSFFSGISLDVTPQIDERGIVMLHVHPAISSASTKDMAVTIEGKESTFPGVQVSINETDSMVRVANGEIVALGGLMEMEGNEGHSGVPGLSQAPVVGGLFRYKTTSSSKRELVILIKPTVLNGDGSGAEIDVPRTPMLPPGRE